MKLKTKLTALVAILGLGLSSGLMGQAVITAFNAPITEDFSTFDGTGHIANFSDFGAGFPDFSGFYDRDGSYSNANRTYALRDNSDSTEIAFGMKRPSSTAVASLNWQLVNNTGTEISEFNISWDAWQLSEAGRATELVLWNYQADAGFTSTGLTSTTFTAGTSAEDANLASILVSAQSATIVLDTPLADEGTLTLGWRWLQGDGSGGNAHVGLTNLSATAVPEPGTYAALIGLAALGFVVYRRRKARQEA